MKIEKPEKFTIECLPYAETMEYIACKYNNKRNVERLDEWITNYHDLHNDCCYGQNFTLYKEWLCDPKTMQLTPSNIQTLTILFNEFNTTRLEFMRNC